MIATVYNLKKQETSTSPSLLDAEQAHFVAEGFRSRLPVRSGIERHLNGVLNDTLSHPGSLARAQLAFSIMKSFGCDEFVARDVGIAIEYFHTASLLFDDLPCMDNASMRRGYACPHTVHGESATILGALSLITQAYGLLWSALNTLPIENRAAASALVNECLGVNGILNGQSFDLNFAESGRKKEDVLRIAEGKTVTLIRLTLLLPALMNGVDATTRETIEHLAASWGLAYQILDDFKDSLMSASETGKTTARDGQLDHPNLPHAMGAVEAARILGEKLDQSRAGIVLLHRCLPGLAVLDRLQATLEEEYACLATRLVEHT
jgi:geranylgeranyl diphosphate synthase, type II